jgi:hypothetical protein
MKRRTKIFRSLLKSVTRIEEPGSHNYDRIIPFEEKESPKHVSGKNDLNAYSLFSAFTADIIKENTLFTR